MGLTPIEDRSDTGAERPREEGTPGVSQRVRSAVTRLIGGVFEGLGKLFSPDGSAGEPARGRTETNRRESADTALRKSGQARLESRSDRQLPEYPPNRKRDETQDGQIEARVRDDTLCLYDSGCRDAYITSDVYERVKR